MSLSNAVWCVVIAASLFGICRELFVTVRRIGFSAQPAGWTMFYIGTIVLAAQPLVFPSDTAPAGARAYNIGGGAVLIIGLCLVLGAKYFNRPESRSTTQSKPRLHDQP